MAFINIGSAGPPITIVNGGVTIGAVNVSGAAAVGTAVRSGVRLTRGGLPATSTNPALADNPAVTGNWTLAGAGSGATVQNQIDATLAYEGWRLQCAPAAQNLARLLASTVNAGVHSVVPLLSDTIGTKGRGQVRLRSSIDLQRTVVTGDAFHAHVGIVSNYPSAGGFLGLYVSDAIGTGNWQLAFLSGAAAYNFPFPVPQRLVDTGITAINNPVRLEIIASNDGTTRQLDIQLDGVSVATLTDPTLSANELAVLTGAGGIPRHAQFAVSKAAGNDTLAFWIGILDGFVDYQGVME